MCTAKERDFVELARDIKPILRERNAKADADRVIPDETIRELKDMGFFRMLQPTRWGGYECHPIEFFDAAIEVATREQDRTLKLALLEARGPPAAYLLLEQGVPRASEVRLRRAMSTR